MAVMRSMVRNVCLGLGLVALLLGASPARAQVAGLTWDQALKAPVSATFEPATAKRGQTVTLQVIVDLQPEFYSYSLTQTDDDAKEAAPQWIWGTIPADLVLAGAPGEFAPVKGSVLGGNILEGQVVYQQRFVVRPEASPGKRELKFQTQLQVCKHVGDKGQCLPNRRFDLAAALTIGDESVPVDPKFAALVKKDSPGAPANPPNPLPDSPSREGPKADQPKSDKPKTAEVEPTAYITAESPSEYESGLNWVLGQLQAQKAAPQSSLAFILAGIFWGAISLITPCVFPMIPITVSFFLKQSEKHQHRAMTMALVYCGTIVVVLTIAAVLLLSLFRYLSTNPYMNIGLGVLFVIFALSLFGMYDLELPSGLARFTSSREGKGGLAGTMFMALTFTIVSFACVAPFLGGFGGTSAASQLGWLDRVLGGFAFAVTFASPFFILALFPTLLKKLPRSGSWLNSVKVVMGFLELAAALAFFRTSELVLLPRAVLFTYDLVLGLWVAIAILCGLYLLNLYRLPHDTPLEHLGVPRMLFGLLFIALGVYLMPALFKGGPDGQKQRPGGAIYAWVDSFLLPEPQETRKGDLAWSGDLKGAIEQARADSQRARRRQLVLIDNTGETCKNCKLNEANVFVRPEVRDLLARFVRVKSYTDKVPNEFYAPSLRDKFGGDVSRQRADAAANLAFQRAAFGTEQLPLYVILDPRPDGDDKKIAVVSIYDEGKINDPAKFTAYLKDSLGEEGQREQAAR
jgi:thiol:disulfide interchange protein DsbD